MHIVCIGVTDYVCLYIVELICFFALDLLYTRYHILYTRYHYSNLMSSLLLSVIALAQCRCFSLKFYFLLCVTTLVSESCECSNHIYLLLFTSVVRQFVPWVGGNTYNV